MGNRQSSSAHDLIVSAAPECANDATQRTQGSEQQLKRVRDASKAAQLVHNETATAAKPPPPGAGKVPSYFGLLSCSTVDVVPQQLSQLQQQQQHHLLPRLGYSAAATAGSGPCDMPTVASVDVWVVAGQSNAVGDNGGDGQAIPELCQPLPEHMSLFHPGGLWTPLTDPCTHYKVHGHNDHRSIGPDMSFCRTLLALGSSTAVGIVPAAAGGSNLHTQWAPGGPLYNYMIRQTSSSMASLPGARLRGIIWIQGEADAEAGHAADAAAYGARLAAFLSCLRDDLSAFHPCLPVILGIMPTRQRSYFEFIEEIRKQQLALNMPNVIKVDLMGYEFFEQFDHQLVHTSKAGQCAFGIAMALAYYATTHAPRTS